MGDWRVPALPNKRLEPKPRACMLTPEVVERFSVFNFGLILSQLSESTTKRSLPKRGNYTLGDARAVDPLIVALGDVDGWVRAEAATALGTLGDARALQPLRVLLADPYFHVIQQTKEAIAQLEGSV